MAALSPEVALARSTLARYLGVRPGEPVTIEAWTPFLSWARAFVVEARRRGSPPVLAVEDEEGFFRSLAGGGPVPTAPAALASFGGAYVYFEGPEAFPRLFGLRAADLDSALDRHGTDWRAAARASGLRAARMTVAAVTATAAARFGVNVDAWRNEVVEASLVPPSRLRARAERARPLLRARHVTITHPNGTRLELRLPSGRWVEEVGRPARAGHRWDAVWTEIPSGRLIVPVVPGSASGTWEANRPAYDRRGDTPVGVGGRFSFRDGRLLEVAFDRGGERFTSAYARARRGSGPVLGLSVGLNPRVARAPELGDLGEGTLGLRLAGAPNQPPRAGAIPGHVALLHGADAELDGRPWLIGGRTVLRPRRRR